ncbi:hypothetical protein D5R81_12255 [Parashewanella spongiae]|uniref:Uncharacterized protein n=1 Tax=Parashewanella spongiae TaxID=342950 RepID=A0A3A6TW31_9GAMM|nr:hypothetical protein D5R81_12255 [Parashewanella spongiae]
MVSRLKSSFFERTLCEEADLKINIYSGSCYKFASSAVVVKPPFLTDLIQQFFVEIICSFVTLAVILPEVTF